MISFKTADGCTIFADEYGHGTRGVVLAHGGRFNKESWRDQANVLATTGMRVVAIDFRGYGNSKCETSSPQTNEAYHEDVLAAVRYLRQTGSESVGVVGGSFGGWAAAVAAARAEPGEIEKLVLLAHSSIDHPERMQGSKLFVCTKDDPYADGSRRLVDVRKQFEAATGPKRLLILEGNAHAQHIFATKQGTRLLGEITAFLLAP